MQCAFEEAAMLRHIFTMTLTAIFFCAIPVPCSTVIAQSAEEGYFTGSDGNRPFYRKLGTGRPPLVYLHGGPINMNDGGYEIDRLGRGRTLLMFDQRSGGRSELVEDGRLQFNLFVADVEALRLHFGLEKMILVGQSFGTDVASNYAVQ